MLTIANLQGNSNQTTMSCHLTPVKWLSLKKKKNKNNKIINIIKDMCLTTTTSGETAQTLKSASSEWELDREAWAASLILRVRTRLECP